jgi:hypothetical protein
MAVNGVPADEELQERVVLDPAGSSEPLALHSQDSIHAYYAPQKISSGEEDALLACPVNPPPRPASFSDPYLYPTLNPEEKERLRRFYLVTEGAERDPELHEHLAQLISLARETTEYEICNLGFSDLDDYIQIVAEGMPTVTVPRREVGTSFGADAEELKIRLAVDMLAYYLAETRGQLCTFIVVSY